MSRTLPLVDPALEVSEAGVTFWKRCDDGGTRLNILGPEMFPTVQAGEVMSKPADCPNCGKPTASDDSPTAYADRHDPSFCSPFTSPSCWGDGNPGFFHDGRWVSLSEVQPIDPNSQQQE